MRWVDALGIDNSDPTESRNTHFPWLAIAALVMVNALWGFSFPVVKMLNELTDAHFGINEASESTAFRVIVSSWMIAVRFTLALVMLVILWNRLVREATRQEWLAGAAIAVMFYVGLVLQVIGLATIPASRSGFLTSLTAVFTPLFGVIVFRRIPSRWMVMGALLAVAGVVVLTGLVEWTPSGIRLAEDAADRWTLGDTLTTTGSVFFAFQVLLLDYYGKRIESSRITPGMFLVTAILGWMTTLFVLFTPIRDWTLVPDMSITDWTELTMRLPFVLAMFALAFFCSLLSFGWMNRYQPQITASQAAVIYSLEPVFASSWALFLPGMLAPWTGMEHPNEKITFGLWMGGALILLANVVALYPSKSNRETKD